MRFHHDGLAGYCAGPPSVAGTAALRGEMLQYCCSFARLSPAQPADRDSGYANPGATPRPDMQEQAAQEGRPFFYALPSADGSDPACHSAIRLPDGTVWFMNTPGSAPVTGVSMQTEMRNYVCRSGAEGN